MSDKIAIISKAGITIYGRIIGSGGRLGKFTVYSDYWGDDGNVYYTFADAENRYDYLQKLHEKRETKNT